MGTSDRELLEKAITEGLAKKYQEELANCQEDASRSAGHDQLIHDIIYPSVSQKQIMRKRLLIGIAVAVLLCGCLAFLFRKPIGEFIRTHLAGGSSQEITITDEEKYAVTYVPAGFRLTVDESDDTVVSYEWENESHYRIVYLQSATSIADLMVSDGQEEPVIIDDNGLTIYCWNQSNHICYTWNDGKYSMTFMTADDAYRGEILKMLHGLKQGE